ncbi:MAG: TonB-dependent receptor [Bacteroidetes bacterium]|nr:TonB-dependent receptor [Bacteroidota bacterium]
MTNNKKIIFQIIIFLFFNVSVSLIAQGNLAVLKGKVTDSRGEILPFANIILKENNVGVASDANGNYRLSTRPGVYTVEISFVGYETYTDKVILAENRVLEINYSLKSISFNIGGIEVIGTNDFIPLESTTKTEISSGEIEHIQASSLNDVMQLIPGVETTNPTLNEVSQAQIRGGEGYGTQIMLDGAPISNNSNMQEGVGISTSRGVDMRAIPAENIQKVEILRGIPSAKYGDLIDGLIIVKTKSSVQPARFKMKYNPNIYEANLGSGVSLGEWAVNGNINIASSQRDIRIEGDGYTRLALQLSTERNSESFSAHNIIYFTRAFDERLEQPGYALREASYNKDITAKYTGNFDFVFNSFSELNTSISVNYTNRDSYFQQLISRDNIVISDRVTEGTQEGFMVFGTYLGKKWVKGEEWNLYANTDYTNRFYTGDYLNSLLAGFTWKNDFNIGKGIVFDPLYPPSLSVPTPRIRTFNQIPSYQSLSFYLEDKIVGKFIKPFTLQIGFRYDIYRPTGIDFKGLWGKGDLIKGKNGSYFNPRINFSYNLTEYTQLRLNYGTTTLAPNFARVFAQDDYFDIVDTSSVVDPGNPESNFSLVSTYIKKVSNPELKAPKQKKYEVSLDQEIGFFGFSLTGFINKTDNDFSTIEKPVIFYKYSYPLYPDLTNRTVKDTLMDTYYSTINDGWSETKGVEFSLRTKKIAIVNTIFKMDASYYYKTSGVKNNFYFSTMRYIKELGIEVFPRYNDYSTYSKNLLINYRFDIQAEPLGVWVTLHLQQKVVEIDGRKNYADTLATGYYTAAGELVSIPESQRTNPLYEKLSRNIESYQLNEENKPVNWLVNLKVSKSLWQGAAISFYVNNLLASNPLYKSARSTDKYPSYTRRNPGIFYGIEFHSSLDGLYK